METKITQVSFALMVKAFQFLVDSQTISSELAEHTIKRIASENNLTPIYL